MRNAIHTRAIYLWCIVHGLFKPGCFVASSKSSSRTTKCIYKRSPNLLCSSWEEPTPTTIYNSIQLLITLWTISHTIIFLFDTIHSFKMQFSLLTILSVVGLATALAVPAAPGAHIDVPALHLDKRCSDWNKAFNPCICPSQAAACDGTKVSSSCTSSLNSLAPPPPPMNLASQLKCRWLMDLQKWYLLLETKPLRQMMNEPEGPQAVFMTFAEYMAVLVCQKRRDRFREPWMGYICLPFSDHFSFYLGVFSP